MGTSNRLIALNNGVIVAPEYRRYILNVQDEAVLQKVTTHIPPAEVRSYDKGWLVSLPMHEDTVAILRNQGMDTREMEPLRYVYTPPKVEGKFDAMMHQIATSAFLAGHKRAFCGSTMRTGKTASVVLAINYLQSMHFEKAALIVCTVSTMTGVWKDTIESTVSGARVQVLHGKNAQHRRELFKQPADYYIINYDGVKLLEEELTEAVTSGKLSIIVLDELTHYGNVGSARWKSMNRVANGDRKGSTPAKFVWGLSGTMGTDSLAVFGYVKMVNPTRMPFTSRTSWQNHVQYKWGSQTWQWKDVEDVKDRIAKVLQPIIRFDKADIMDLPPILKQVRDCSLTPSQLKLYAKLKQDRIAMSETGEQIEAVHKAALVTKLLQTSLGAVRDNEGNIVDVDNTARIQVLKEILGETNRKVLIFSAFRAVMYKLEEELGKDFSVARIDGSVGRTARDKILHDFQNEEAPRILVAHPQTTAFGTELSAADTLVFDGPPLSGTFIYAQALERLSSLKQEADSIQIIQLAATPEERHIFRALDNGISMSDAINDVFRDMTIMNA